jgi:hypothetical protein
MKVRTREQREEDLLFFSRHTNSQLPYCITIDSGVPGPTIGLSGGTHGSEPAGVVALRSLVEEIFAKKLTLKKGRIICFIGNPFAYLEDVRFIKQNLNRMFLETDLLEKDAEGFRVWEIKRFIASLNTLDFFLDIHTVSRGESQILVYQHEHAKNLGLSFSTCPIHLLLFAHLMPGALIEEVSRCFPDSSVYAVECGNNESETAIAVASYKIYSLLHFQKMIDEKPVSHLIEACNDSVDIYRIHSLIKPYEDFRFIIENLTTGTFLPKGTHYATSCQGDHKTPEDLYTVMPSKNPNPKDSDAGFLCTKEVARIS